VAIRRGSRKPAVPVEEPQGTRGFEAFFEEQHARFFSALCFATGDAVEAEEIMQEAFVRIWERWERVREHPDPEGYLFRTGFNLFRDGRRRALLAARRVLHPQPLDDAFARVEEREDVLEALRRLTPRQRAAIVLTDLLDVNSEEAGQMLGVRAATVRALASQARAAIRRRLEEADA
jgi:RNA polymerase sigma-70 factor (ECF subfamily)